LARVDGMYSVVVSIFEFVVKICQRLSKRERERERERNRLHTTQETFALQDCKLERAQSISSSPVLRAN
jgi:hypothetical protein